jgi:hypothetical protein
MSTVRLRTIAFIQHPADASAATGTAPSTSRFKSDIDGGARLQLRFGRLEPFASSLIRRSLATAAAASIALSLSCSADASGIAGAISGNGAKSASGRVSLSVTIAASGTQTTAGTTETKSELAQADLAFDLGLVSGIGGQLFKWDNATYGGTSRWYEEHITPSVTQISGTKQSMPCTNVDSTLWNFSSAASGGQIGDVRLELQGTQYQLFIDETENGPTTDTQIFTTNCTGDGHTQTSKMSSMLNLVPFSGYFSSDDAAAAGTRVSITRPLVPGATRVNDVLQWTDKMVIFSSSTSSVVTVPVNVRLTWDFTIQ